MENSNENLLQGGIKDRLYANMRNHYKRTDSNNDTIITLKNDGPGDVKCNLFENGREERHRERVVRAGDTSRFAVSDYRGDIFKVETSFQEATVTIDNVKKEY